MALHFGYRADRDLYLLEEDCPTVQCGICDQWMCDCQSRTTSCKGHFDEPCMKEGEPE